VSQVREVSIQILPNTTGLTEALDRAAQIVQAFGVSVRKASMELWWHNRILFADTEKERRMIRREYARATRKPALIHNGRKPR